MVIRGCGLRKDNAMYLSVPTSMFGQPLEFFLVDPAIKWDGGTLRAPMLVPDPKGVYHVLLGIGREYYPYYSDFHVEAAKHGVSKRIPNGFDPAKLTRGKSKFLLVHPRGIPQFGWKADFTCKTTGKRTPLDHQCTTALWPLSAIGKSSEKHEITKVEPDLTSPLDQNSKHIRHHTVLIQTPSVTYGTDMPVEPLEEADRKYASGVMLSFPLFQFEWVSKRKTVPKEIADRFSTTDYKLECAIE